MNVFTSTVPELTHINKKKSSALFLCILILVFLSHSGCTPNWEIHNPYPNVNWANDGQYKANFHAHTTVSDGRSNPQNVADIYHSPGNSILAITDHNSVTRPWTDFSNISASERSRGLIEMVLLWRKIMGR